LIAAVALYWALAMLAPWHRFGAAVGTAHFVQSMAWLAFVLAHGSRRYGWDKTFMFLGITSLIAWTAESIALALGFPFGAYHYTGVLGFQIGAVPAQVLAAYCVGGYLAWSMASIYLGSLGAGIRRREMILVPVVAAGFMVLWDLCLDPIRSTVEGAWIWEGAGPYFGVPLSNFVGWFLTTYLIFQVFALYLYRFGSDRPLAASKLFWYLVPVMYLGVAVEFLLHPFFQTEHLAIYRAMALVAVLTMVPAAILGIVRVRRMER
jgi:putative membrane protein